MLIKDQGFSLIELMIVIAVIAIISAIVYPSYKNSITKSRRSDAITTLINIQAAEEKYRSSNPSYGTLAQVWNGISNSKEGHYTVAISNTGATTYTITATAQGKQASDTGCTVLTLAKNGATETRSPAACWT